MSGSNLVFAAAPVLLLIYWMTKKNPMPSARALPIAALLAIVFRLVWFQTEIRLVLASVIAGLLVALTPILIVWGAIFLFRTMEHCGAMEVIRRWLNHISQHRLAQVVIIGWSFQFLIEGASGFGTPAALAGPLLVGIGFPPIRVAMACLILNSIPVSFGAVGTPTWFGFGQLGLSPSELQEIGWKTALIHSVAACFVPLLAFRLLLTWKEIRRGMVFIYVSIAASVLPMVLISRVDYEFPAVGGGLLGLFITVLLARYNVGLGAQAETPDNDAAKAPSIRAVVRALFPLWGTVLALLLTRIPQLGLRSLLTSESPGVEFSLGWFGTFSTSTALVLGLRDILGTEIDWSHQVLYVPSLIPFVMVSVVSWWVLSAPRGTAKSGWLESAARMRKPVLALLGALVLVRVLMVGGEQSSVMIVGESLASAAGPWWQYLASYLGAVGAFFAGSCTISNLTFGPIQDTIADQMGHNRTTILALQSVGGAMGNMVAIHNIVAVCSVLSLENKEGQILRKTVWVMLLYGLAAAMMGSVLRAMEVG